MSLSAHPGYPSDPNQAYLTERQLKPLWEWPELDVLAVQQKARKRWQKATAIINISKKTATPHFAVQLEEMSSAAQQRYARSEPPRQRDDERAGGTRGRARATANPAASTHTNELERIEDKAGARDSARVHCPDSQALTAITTPSVVP